MDKKDALVILGVCLIVGAIFQGVAQHEAALLGISGLELALLGLAAGGVARRLID